MSRPSSKQLLLTSSKAIVKLQRRNLASLTAAAAAAGPLQHHQHQLLLLASQQQQQQPSQTASGSVAGGSSPALVPSSSSSGGAPSSSAAGSSKARATAGWSAVIEGPAQQPTAALFDLTAPAYRPVSSAASQPVALSVAAAAAGSQREQQHRPSTPPPSSSASLLPVVVPPTVRTRRESASSARPPTTSTREPASIAQQPASPTQGHALPAASSAAYPYGPPRALWPADGPTNAAPAHVRPEPSSRLVFETGAFGIPKAVAYVPFTSSATSPKGKARADHPPEPSDGTLAQVGEDAYFVRASGFVHALGIADGVGGWAKRKDAPNANAGRFSSLLMGHISAEVARSSAGPSLLVADWASSRGLDVPGQGAGDLDPVVVMQRGYERCLEQARREGLQGSATALLALLSEDQLRIANLGDCCLTLIRNGEIFFRTTEMQHSFNQPFQLGTNSRDSPANDSLFYSIAVEHDDIVVLCTDGLSDNLFESEILEEISSFQRPAAASASGSRPVSPSSPSGTAPAQTPSPSQSKASSDRPASPIFPSSPPQQPSSPPPRSPSDLPFSAQRISEALCSRAKARSEQTRQSASPPLPAQSGSHTGDASQRSASPSEAADRRDSPFGVRARREGFRFHGGKADDVTVVVARLKVLDEGAQPSAYRL